MLKEEGVFRELCNQTELIATNQTSCVEQDAKFNSIFVTACLLANFFSTLCGIVMDKFGLLCARVFTSTQMTLGLIMMIFYSNRTALEYGAYLIAMSSIGNLLTNITVQVSAKIILKCVHPIVSQKRSIVSFSQFGQNGKQQSVQSIVEHMMPQQLH